MDVKLVSEKYIFDDHVFQLKRVKDLDSLVDQVSDEDFNIDERLPYWAELWPSANGLCHFLFKNPQYIAGKSVLELGCGLGLTSLSIASLNPGNFLATDYEEDALKMLKENFILNKIAMPEFKHLDWREPELKKVYDVIIASDILYEERFFLPLKKLLTDYLAVGGTIIIAEPNRPIAIHFFVKMMKAGYKDRLVDEIVNQGGHDIKVSIHTLNRTE